MTVSSPKSTRLQHRVLRIKAITAGPLEQQIEQRQVETNCKSRELITYAAVNLFDIDTFITNLYYKPRADQ